MQTGSLVLEWTDLKELDEDQENSAADTLGCYKGANGCEYADFASASLC